MVVLIWVYYNAQIVLAGAEFTRVYAEHHGSKKPSERCWAILISFPRRSAALASSRNELGAATRSSTVDPKPRVGTSKCLPRAAIGRVKGAARLQRQAAPSIVEIREHDCLALSEA